MEDVTIETESIRLDQFLKWVGIVGTGGEAKFLIQEGMVQVNGNTETRRTAKIFPGDQVTLDGKGSFRVAH